MAKVSSYIGSWTERDVAIGLITTLSSPVPIAYVERVVPTSKGSWPRCGHGGVLAQPGTHDHIVCARFLLVPQATGRHGVDLVCLAQYHNMPLRRLVPERRSCMLAILKFAQCDTTLVRMTHRTVLPGHRAPWRGAGVPPPHAPGGAAQPRGGGGRPRGRSSRSPRGRRGARWQRRPRARGVGQPRAGELPAVRPVHMPCGRERYVHRGQGGLGAVAHAVGVAGFGITTRVCCVITLTRAAGRCADTGMSWKAALCSGTSDLECCHVHLHSAIIAGERQLVQRLV